VGVVVLAAALAVVVPSGMAQAASAGAYGTFTLAGASKAYTGTMTLPGGFPATTFTSTSRQATVVSGASTWQAASTPVGAVYGSSRGLPYLNQRPNADNPTAPAVTTYTFATPTPASDWSFVLGDIDADQATVSATDANGAVVPISGLGFQGVYNYCHRLGGPSCDSANVDDVPSWNTTTGTLVGNTGASDTEGASGWFSPSVPLKTLTISYQQRSGLPVYQTWFATTTSASGAVTVNGRPFGGSTVTIQNAAGATIATTTAAGDGSWSVPGLAPAAGYQVTVETPTGATAVAPRAFDTSGANATGLDVDFTITPVTVTSTITGGDGQPAADEPIVITRDGDDAPTVTTTTDADGGFTAVLLPQQEYTLVVAGATDQPITFTAPAVSGPLDPLVQPAPPVTTPPAPPVPPVTSAPTPSAPPANSSAAADAGTELAFTGSQPVWPEVLGAGLLVAAGLALTLVARRRA
jgi:hypothetical protein